MTPLPAPRAPDPAGRHPAEGPPELYVVYFNASDFPGRYAVRRWVGDRPDWRLEVLADTLELARDVIPRGATRLPPCPGDDPVILEVWW